MDRRMFLKTSLASTLASALASKPASLLGSAPAVLGTARSRKYRMALIGSGWWGMNISRVALASGRCEMAAMCDVDERLLNPAAEEIEQLSGVKPKRYRDFRELLDREKVDIAIVATPDHWHPLNTIAAVRAGAHVFVEKPIGHTIGEGRAMVKAARETGKVVQVGTHRRVSPHNVSGRKFILDGHVGKIGMVRSFVLFGGGPEPPMKNVDPPKGLDWDMWCGPAPVRPFNGDPEKPEVTSGIHPKGFRRYLDYANGTLGDWGVHWLDQVLWVMEEKWPKTVYSTGGRAIRGAPVLTPELQSSDAPDHQVVAYEFDDFTCTWEHRHFAGNNTDKGESLGCYFYGTKGVFHMGWRGGWTFYPVSKAEKEIHEEPQLHGPDTENIKELWEDFLSAIETGRKPASDIEELHYSTNMCLLGMLSLKAGRSVRWDGEKEQIIGDPEANALLRREYRAPWVYPES